MVEDKIENPVRIWNRQFTPKEIKFFEENNWYHFEGSPRNWKITKEG